MVESVKEVNKNMDVFGNKLFFDVGFWFCFILKVIFFVLVVN